MRRRPLAFVSGLVACLVAGGATGCGPAPEAVLFPGCWIRETGMTRCGALVSESGTRAGGEQTDLAGVVRVSTSLLDGTGDNVALTASIDGCPIWMTPMLIAGDKWTPRIGDKATAAMGCVDDPVHNSHMWAEDLLDRPFVVRALDPSRVRFESDLGSIDFALETKKAS